nr:DNA-directed DNA polymerase [Tanacetum cinerariifolium]
YHLSNLQYHLSNLQKKLSLPELTPTRMTLELADRSITRPKGVAEDIFVKVGKFHFLTNFVVVDFEADPRVPLILGRSFLRTDRALIDVYRDEITLRVNDESITFNLNQTMRYYLTYDDTSVNRVDVIDIGCEDFLQDVLDFQYNPKSSSPTLVSDALVFENDSCKEPIVKSSSPTLTPFGEKDSYKLPVIIAKILKVDEKEALINVLKSHKRAIAWKISDIKGIDPRFCTYKILMEDDYKPAVQSQRGVNPKIHDVIKKEVIKLLDGGMIYPISDSPWVSLIYCVPKRRGMTVVANENNELIPTRLVTGWRVCIDYRKLNDATRKHHFPHPFMDQMLERTFAYRRMPFGLCNAPGTFQRYMMSIFHDMIEKKMEVFMDNFLVFGDSFSSCLTNLDKMLNRCEETNLVLNWEKCHFMRREGIVLGHKILKSGIEVDREKVDVIAKLSHPTTIKGVRSFLGHVGFYRRFIQDFSKIARPMTYLLEKETLFVFFKECIEAFNTLKKKLTKAPILFVRNWNLPFELMCDASDYAIGLLRGGFCLSCDLKAKNSFTYDPNAYSFNETSNNFNHLPQPQYENYLCNLCGNNSHDGYDCQQQFSLVYEHEPSYNQNYNECNHPTFFDDNEDHSVQYKEYLENFSKEIAASNSNQEKEKPPQCFDIRQLVREECCIEVCEKQKQNMEDTMLELVEVCRQKELYCMHDNPAEHRTRIVESLQNFRVIHKSSISLNNTSQISPVHAIVPILPTEEPEYSLSMGYEHPNTTPEIESDEIIKSGVKELVPIPNEYEVTSEDKRECDVLVYEDSSTFDVCDDHSEILSDSNNDDILSDDDAFEDIEYVEASLPNLEISFASIPIFEESDNSLSDNSSPKFETFSDHTKETKSGSTTTHAPEYDSFCFKIEPDQERLTSVFMKDISDESSNDPLLEEVDLFLASDNSIPPGIENFDYDSEGDIRFLEELLIDDSIPFPNNESFNFEDNPLFPRPPPEPPDVESFFDSKPDVIAEEISDELNEDNCFDSGEEIDVLTNDEDDDYFPFMFVIRIFLPYLIYPEVFPLLIFAESEDTIFDPGISV